MDGLVFRLFVSSTFTDFEAEREILQRDVFPRLRERASEGNARFVPIDLRWGISREAVDQQETIEICLKEVDRCHAEGQPPRLLALLGHRRGWRPLPPSVPADVWKLGEPALAVADLDRLKRAYRRDDNAQPASWILQPAASWVPGPGPDLDEESLLHCVKSLVRAGGTKDQARSLLGAATEQELLRAWSDGQQRRRAGTDALILVRTLDQLPAVISAAQEPSAKKFLELRRKGSEWVPDEDAHHELDKLAREFASQERSAWAWRESYGATWNDTRAMVQLTEQQQQNFADLAFNQLSRLMAVSLRLERPGQALSREGRSHAAVRTRLLTPFAGREHELKRFRELVPRMVPNVTGPPRPVVIVSGPPGSGKSALMAKAAEQAEKHSTVIARFAGATRASASAAGLCRSINLELAGLLDIETSRARHPDLFAVADLLALATRRGRGFNTRSMLAVFIDGADLVTAEAERATGRPPTRFGWLPPMMPPQVTLILSADEDNAPSLADWFHAHELVRLGPLTPKDASEMLDEILRQAGRSLSSGQPEALLERERDGWLPLPLWVGAQDTIRWSSWAAKGHLQAATTFSDVLDTRLSQRHGKALVASALGYLLAARDGLAEDELRELLAHDERVMDDLADRYRYHLLPIVRDATRAVPDVVLSRLLQDLDPYLAEYPVAGQALMRLAHEEFRRSALRYVSDADGRPSADWHDRIASYFRDQGLTGRAATELPYQLARAGQWDKLTAVITDVSYLEGIVTGAYSYGREGSAETVWSATLALAELLALARQAADPGTAESQAVRVLQAILNAVVRERRSLARWPQTWWQQLANRLLTNQDAPGVLTAALGRQVARSGRAWLELTSAGAAPALGVAYQVNEPDPREATRRPSAAVTAMLSVGPHDALTVMDGAGTLALWDPAGFEPPTAFRRPDGPGLAALVRLGDSRALACDREGTLELWDVGRYRKQYWQIGSAGVGVTAMAYFPEEHLLVTATEELTRCWDFDGSAAECRLADQPRWVSRPGAQWLWGLCGGRLLIIGKGRLRPAEAGRGASPAWEAACVSVANHADVWRETLPAQPRAAAVDEPRGLMALGDTARHVTLHRLETGALEGASLDIGDVATAIAFTPPGLDGEVTLLVGRADGWLARYAAPWHGRDGLLPAHGRAVRAIFVHPQSAMVITGGADGWVKSWDLRSGEWHELSAVRQVRAAAFDTSGRWALACCGDAGSYRVDAIDGRWTAIIGLAASLVPVFAALPGGRGIVVTLKNGSLGWLSADSTVVRAIPLPPGVRTVKALAAAADGTSVFVADTRGGLSLISLDETGTADPFETVPVEAAASAPAAALALLADGGALTGDGLGRLTTWTAGGPDGLSPGHRTQTRLTEITALAAAPGLGVVAAGSRNGEVVLVNDSRELPIGQHGAKVTSIAVGPGSRFAVTTSGGDDPALCVWDLAGMETERLVTRLPCPDEPIAVGFLPDRLGLAVLGRHGRLRNLRLHLAERGSRPQLGPEPSRW